MVALAAPPTPISRDWFEPSVAPARSIVMALPSSLTDPTMCALSAARAVVLACSKSLAAVGSAASVVVDDDELELLDDEVVPPSSLPQPASAVAVRSGAARTARVRRFTCMVGGPLQDG